MIQIFLILLLLSVVFASSYLAYRKVKSLNTVVEPSNLVVLLVKVPKDEEKKEGVQTAPVSAERFFSSLHGLLNTTASDTQEIINFEIFSSSEGIKFYVAIPENIRNFVESQIYAHYPGAQITKLEKDYLKDLDLDSKSDALLVPIKLSKKEYFPIKTFKDFEVDPLGSLTESMSEVKGDDKILLQFSIKPVEDTWQEKGHKYIEALRSGSDPNFSILSSILSSMFKGFRDLIFGFDTSEVEKAVNKATPKLSVVDEQHLTSIEEKLSKMGYETWIKLFIASSAENTGKYKRSMLGSFRQYTSSNLNSLVPDENRTQTGKEALDSVTSREVSFSNANVLNTEELASIFHFPSSVVSTPNISWSASKKVEPPLNLPIEGDVTYFGITNFREKQVKFGIKNNEDRMRHMYFIGKTGSGKSTLFENMVIQDIKDGRGAGFIDPHGETIEKILTRIPKDRIDDVVLIDPSDSEHPVGINVMECPDPDQKNLLASSVLSAFKLQFGYSWGPRLEYLLNYALLTLIEIEGTSLLGVTRLLTDKNYRKYILEKVEDPLVKKFWSEEYKELEQSFGAEAVSPIQNKVGRLLSSTTLRNILGQRNSTIQFDEVMNDKKILLVNLSKGKIGDDNANLLGSLIVNRLTFYAMQRASLMERDRVPFYLYVDEFQNFATESFVTILSEARKYGLSLHLTHQYIDQLPETIKDAILGNVGSMVALTLGAQDANELESEFAPTFAENDLISQEKFNFYCKLHIDGATSKPFSGRSLPPVYDSSEDFSAEIKEHSREKYSRDKNYVQKKIMIWLNRPFDAGMAIAERYRSLSEED